MAASANGRPVSRGRAKMKRPTWQEWKDMHWRERQRIRASGIVPPAPPHTHLRVPVNKSELRALERLAAGRRVSPAEYVAELTRQHLARKVNNQRKVTA